MKKKFILITNGHLTGWESILYAAELTKIMNGELTLIGIIEKTDKEHPVEEIFSKAISLFQEKEIAYTLQLMDGDTEEKLVDMAWEENAHLIIGPLGRTQFRHWLHGRSFRQILATVPVPIFYIREARLPIKKILLCFSSFAKAGKAKEIGLEIGEKANAEVKLLHVVPPLESDSLGNVDEKSIASLVDEKPALALQKAQETAENLGVPSDVVLRHGPVVRQIIEELEKEKYDLICMGSSFSDPSSLRHHYMPNVTAEVAEAINCPILTSR